ncbi:kinase-like domain-containing protein, partial [Immersiella caudata]
MPWLGRKQLCIGYEPRSAAILLKNLSRNGTLVKSTTLGTLKLESQLAIPEGGAAAEIRTPAGIKIEICFPDHRGDWGYCENLSVFLTRVSPEVPDLRDLKVASTTASSNPNYIREAIIGSGAFGTVYKVLHRHTAERYAMKEFRDDIVFAATEAKVLRSISHEHIIRFQEFHLNQGPPTLVMEFVNGRNLKDEHSAIPFTKPESKQIAYQMLLALQHLHYRGITHRDLKPANAMLVSRDPVYVKVMDFGLASTSPEVTAQGTPMYAAPEMLAGNTGSSKVDIWSLGVIVMEFTLRLPKFTKSGWHSKILSYLAASDNSILSLFLSALLQLEPGQRPTAEECLEHEFFGHDTD